MGDSAVAIIRILLIDDHILVRSGIRLLIESRSNLRVIAESSTAAEGIEAATHHQPDIILLDLDLGSESGADSVPALLQASPTSRIVLLTGVRDFETQRRAVRLGAMGLVTKEKALETVIKAIEKVHAGEAWIDRQMMAQVLHDFVRPVARPVGGSPEANRATLLSVREREVVALVGKGLKNQQIALQLSISEATVRHHLTSIFNKLHVADRVELVLYALRNGLADLPPTSAPS